VPSTVQHGLHARVSIADLRAAEAVRGGARRPGPSKARGRALAPARGARSAPALIKYGQIRQRIARQLRRRMGKRAPLSRHRSGLDDRHIADVRFSEGLSTARPSASRAQEPD
jgi:hypothetical protein